MTAIFPTDWDINYYRTDYESDEHWELRKAFIEAHKDSFPEDELVCLAQVFTNIEFLGCRYPARTMERVAHLSKEVAAKFRQSRSGRLKRTFVGASDAASAKAKGRGTQAPITQSINQNEQCDAQPNVKEEVCPKKSKIINEEDCDNQRPSFSMNTIDNGQSTTSTKAINRIPNTGFIIYETLNETNNMNILYSSAAKQGAIIKFDMEVSTTVPNTLECIVRINDKIYATVPMATNKKEAKIQAFDKALEYARKIHYTIKQKSVYTHSIDVEQDSTGKTNQTDKPHTKLDAGNKGFKMMQMLGWTGGALGVSGNGIEEPISIEMQIDRSGLGLSSDSPNSKKLNYDFFVDYLTKYKRDEKATYDLVFSKDFSKEERKTLHEIASRLALKSRSRNGKDGSRYLIIHKKLILEFLANEILNDGFRAKYYELISPTEPIPYQVPNNVNKPKKLKPQPSYTQQQTKSFPSNAVGFNYNLKTKRHPKKKHFRRI